MKQPYGTCKLEHKYYVWIRESLLTERVCLRQNNAQVPEMFRK